MKGPVAPLRTQILHRTVALDPKYNDAFIPTHKSCKCGGDIVKGTNSSGYAVNYRECIKCGRSFFEEDKIWRDLLEDRVKNRKREQKR